MSSLWLPDDRQQRQSIAVAPTIAAARRVLPGRPNNASTKLFCIPATEQPCTVEGEPCHPVPRTYRQEAAVFAVAGRGISPAVIPEKLVSTRWCRGADRRRRWISRCATPKSGLARRRSSSWTNPPSREGDARLSCFYKHEAAACTPCVKAPAVGVMERRCAGKRRCAKSTCCLT
jgi:hypothetical protein